MTTVKQKTMDRLNRAICWLLGDQWEYFTTEQKNIDTWRHWYQCRRCKWYTNTLSLDPEKKRVPKPFHVFRRFRAWLDRALGIRWHSQNLNEKAGQVVGSIWRYGRGWLNFGNNSIGLEWIFFKPDASTGIDFDLGGEDEFKFSIRLRPLFGLYFSISQILPRKWTRKWGWWDWSWGRRFGVNIHNGSIWFEIFHDSVGWSNLNSWQEFNFHYVDFLLGRMQTATETLDTGEITIAFLEGHYRIKYTKELRRWWRPRWPWGKTAMIKFELDMDDNPIPVPGKGENSWDIDDDAIYSTYVSASTLQAAIGRLTESVYRDRLKYGGIDWTPSERQKPVAV